MKFSLSIVGSLLLILSGQQAMSQETLTKQALKTKQLKPAIFIGTMVRPNI